MSMYSQVGFSLKLTVEDALSIDQKIQQLPHCGHDDISVVNGDTINAKITLNYGLNELIKFLQEVEQVFTYEVAIKVGHFSSEEINMSKTSLYAYNKRFFLVDTEIINNYLDSDTKYDIRDLWNKRRQYWEGDYENDVQYWINEYIQDSK